MLLTQRFSLTGMSMAVSSTGVCDTPNQDGVDAVGRPEPLGELELRVVEVHGAERVGAAPTPGLGLAQS